MTVMQNAVQRAAKRLLRDFAEVEQLQVSVKGPGDFVSQADLRAEQTLRDDLKKARPGYAFLMEELAHPGRTTGRGAGSSTRSTAPPTSCTASRTGRSASALEKRLPDGGSKSSPAWSMRRRSTRCSGPKRARGAFVNERRLRVSARRDLQQAMFATGIPFAAPRRPCSAVSRARSTW